MTELDVVLQKLLSIEDTQKAQSADIKDLSRGFTILAAQSEQISSLQGQTSALWRKIDAITGPGSHLERVREHQKHCPKDEMHRTFAWIFKILGAHSFVLMGIGGWLFWLVTQR